MLSVAVKMLMLAIYGSSMALLPLFTACGVILPMLYRPRRSGPGARVLLTARFDSHNWARAHLIPLAQAASVGAVLAVVDGPTVAHERIRYVPPPLWLARVVGRVAARALWVAWIGLKHPPDIVMGYHFFPNGLIALLTARLLGSRAVYQMTGGPVELEGGGGGIENVLLSRVRRPSRALEWLALRLCRAFDAVVVRGARARAFLADRASQRNVAIICGAVPVTERSVGEARDRPSDVAYVGRLAPYKQPEHLLEVLGILVRRLPSVRAVVCGDGPLRDALAARARSLGIEHNVTFRGHVEDVQSVLRESKTFVLTSRHEGLSIALAEAMAAGAVPVVADVGDLRELVIDGVTGYLIKPGDFAAYAARLERLLTDPDEWAALSAAARARALAGHSLDAVVARWERLVVELMARRQPVRT